MKFEYASKKSYHFCTISIIRTSNKNKKLKKNIYIHMRLGFFFVI